MASIKMPVVMFYELTKLLCILFLGKVGMVMRGASSDAVDFVVTSLLRARDCTTLSTYDTYDKFLSVCEAALLRVQGQEWRTIIKGIEKAFPEFQAALGELMFQAGCSYRDLLGPCYMTLGHYEPHFGQFFTPWSTARFLAEILIGNLQNSSKEDPCYILDSSCGSGVMLLAIADAISNSEVRNRQVYFAGLDIDPLCVKMTRLNLLLHGLMEQTLLIKQPNDVTTEEREILQNSLLA